MSTYQYWIGEEINLDEIWDDYEKGKSTVASFVKTHFKTI
jgi:hypothetical protein